jgi:hypothetical protein
MRRNLKTFAGFFAVQFLSYSLFCWNYRAVAQARYGDVFASDVACATVSFYLIKKVSGATSHWAMAGYILGGACGALFSVWLTKRIYGQ